MANFNQSPAGQWLQTIAIPGTSSLLQSNAAQATTAAIAGRVLTLNRFSRPLDGRIIPMRTPFPADIAIRTVTVTVYTEATSPGQADALGLSDLSELFDLYYFED